MIWKLIVSFSLVFATLGTFGIKPVRSAEKIEYSKDSLRYTSLYRELTKINYRGGKLTFNNDQRLNNLIELHRNISFSQKGFEGFRIQIYSESSVDTDIKYAEQYRDTFKYDFPDVRIYLKYFDPDFKIRVGNFRSKAECMALLKRIKNKYPRSYPVKTFIYYNELKQKTLAEEEEEKRKAEEETDESAILKEEVETE